MATIPPTDAQSSPAAAPTETVALNEGHEFRLLEAETRRVENLNREADQRYDLRFWAVIVASALVLIFIALLIHALCNLDTVLDKEPSWAVIFALYVAPLTASTFLAISLIVAAFRGFKDEDASDIASATNQSLRTSGSVS